MSRNFLQATTNFYINLFSGDDANDGSQTYPWLTLQHAHDWCQNNLDLAGQQLNFQLYGNFAAPLEAGGPFVGQGAQYPQFTGDNSNPWNVIIHTPSHCVTNIDKSIFGFSGVTVQSDSGSCFQSEWYGSRIILGNNNYYSAPNGNHMYATKGGYIFSNGSYQIWGSAQAHACADAATMFISGGDAGVCTIYGTPSFAVAFAYAIERAEIASHTMAWVNAAYGKKFSAQWQSAIAVPAADPNYFPGSVPGTLDATSVLI